MSPGIHGRRNSIVVFVVLSLLSPATRARADAEPVLVWSTYASGAPPVAVAALSEGVVLAGPHRGEALVRFDAAGALLGAVSYGGDPEADDDVRGLASAPALGLVYLVGDARYDEAWFKDVESDGDRDGVELVRWSADGQRMWAADFGGDSYESMGAVAVAATGSIYLVGRTFSHDGIATPGAHRVQHGGGEGGEAYAAKFTADGQMAWATYVGSLGEGGEPAAAVDADGDLYVAFTTLSADLATTGASSSQVGEHGDALLAKFTGEGARAWAIYHGRELAETVAGVAVDPAGRIYLGGQTSSTAGIATPGASQAELASAMDPFVAMFRAE